MRQQAIVLPSRRWDLLSPQAQTHPFGDDALPDPGFARALLGRRLEFVVIAGVSAFFWSGWECDLLLLSREVMSDEKKGRFGFRFSKGVCLCEWDMLPFTGTERLVVLQMGWMQQIRYVKADYP